MKNFLPQFLDVNNLALSNVYIDFPYVNTFDDRLFSYILFSITCSLIFIIFLKIQSNFNVINYKGFTLVELLVVIAILAILAVIGLAVFSGVQKNARDARRREEIDAIAKALEVNKVANLTTYTILANGQFQAGTIPTDTTTAQYSVAWSTTVGAAAPVKPIAWATSSPNPTAPSGTGAWPALVQVRL